MTLFTLFIVFLLTGTPGKEGLRPDHPLPSMDLRPERVGVVESGAGRYGFRLFYDLQAVGDSAPVVVFLHGYGGYNPMYYGAWIRHLVERGQTVIFPYYQDNLIAPEPEDFAGYAAFAIRRAWQFLDTAQGMPRPLREVVDYIGHSYGGVIAARLSAEARDYGMPAPAVVFMAMAGTGPFDQGLLESYMHLPEGTILGAVVSEDDLVVGAVFPRRVFATAPLSIPRLWIALTPRPGRPGLRAGHNEPYALDIRLDNGVRNYNFLRASMVGRTDNHDRLALWRTFDFLQEMAHGAQSNIRLRDFPDDLGTDRRGRTYGRMYYSVWEGASSR